MQTVEIELPDGMPEDEIRALLARLSQPAIANEQRRKSAEIIQIESRLLNSAVEGVRAAQTRIERLEALVLDLADGSALRQVEADCREGLAAVESETAPLLETVRELSEAIAASEQAIEGRTIRDLKMRCTKLANGLEARDKRIAKLERRLNAIAAKQGIVAE